MHACCLTLGREARILGKQRRCHHLESENKSWIGGSLITSYCQGRRGRLHALFGNLSRLFRLNVAPACSASLVLGVCPRLEMNSPLWIVTLSRRHMADSTPPTLPIPPFPAHETLLLSSQAQTLAIVVSISFPGWSKSLSPFDSSSPPPTNLRSLHLRLSLLFRGARWVRFSIKPTLSHSFLKPAATWSCRWLEGSAQHLRIMKNCSSLV
jgi:hypothetical protein